ncbi:L-threo-3-deoxy-hexylosonate aldolase [Recurvomyces mirabilis]|uniref:L-threo-3-deoxy-hexylosonate aldolase n=1 Tax=Recurvomyces mirabilis TaxID=574656 RepID=A0AAE0TMW0_9PEZI|nr:L-threo-3-deoxy-hexylosonate aldolase [Recurvomyces mirabilis]KAK5150510.1 L-threo-3-deoxy-hexylosonate aldolase [Recurvomyces mirabilis]
MASNGDSNGSSSRRQLRHGIYAPTMTFFDKESEDLDIPTIKKHAVRLAKAGLVGLVTMGSNGEAVHLTRDEKTAVTRATREALDEAGFKDVVVIAGTSESSVRLAVELNKEQAAAGAEYALMLPPSYYRAQVNESMMFDYYTTVAEASPLPIILYNYPGAVSGLDMDSDFMIRLVEATKGKVCGAKFTDANTGKLTRVAYATNACSVKSQGSGWMAFGGIADFTLQTAASGGSGIIAGGANVMPKLCVKVWNSFQEGKYEEAMELQKVLSKGDWVLTKAAIAGTKAAIELEFGYGGYPRRPLQRLNEEQRKQIKSGIADAMKLEHSL